ncbi:hypothetical protein DFJ77DRAFT_441448 [Powellomyces hirtus]|nr:hypothetical protein DFJ77DRAFT_441448 [Powellomyces hirtus]
MISRFGTIFFFGPHSCREMLTAVVCRTAKFGEPDERLDQAEKVAWTVGAASAVASEMRVLIHYSSIPGQLEIDERTAFNKAYLLRSEKRGPGLQNLGSFIVHSDLTTAAASSAAMWYAAKRRGRPFRKGAPLAVVALSTLVVSQLVIGGTYVRGRNEIVFQARREAAARAEARRMEEYGWGEPAAKSVPELNRGTV